MAPSWGGSVKRPARRPRAICRRPLKFSRFDGVIGGTNFAVADNAAADEMRALFHLVKNLGDVLAEDRQAQHVDGTEKEDRQKRGGNAGRGPGGADELQGELNDAEKNAGDEKPDTEDA